MAGIGSLTGTIKTTFQYQGQNTQTPGGVYSPLTSSTTITKTLNISNSTANNTAGGADEAFSFIQTIIASGKAVLNIATGMTNVMQQTAVDLGTGSGRLKAYQFRLLSAADDGTLSPAPGTATTVTVTNISAQAAAMDVPIGGFFGSKGSGLAVNITQSGGAVNAVVLNTGGSGYMPSAGFSVSPQQAGGSGCVFMATTNSGGVVNAVTFVASYGGANYSNASAVPTAEVGSYSLYVGSMLAYGDASAAGFCRPTATNKNLLFINNDSGHSAYIETDFFAGTT